MTDAAGSAFEALLKVLDAASVGPDQPILRSPDDVVYVETQLTFAMRKRGAARYHLANVERLSAEMIEQAHRSAAAAAEGLPPHAKTRISATMSQDAFAHELSAFLVAIRSGLDFVATIAARSTKGVTAHSIHDLEKMVGKGRTGPVLNIVKRHAAWLKALRDYRDEIVHRLVMAAPPGGWVMSKDGKVASAILPVVVPVATPRRRADTRRARMMEDEVPWGLTLSHRTATVTYPDGTREVTEHEVIYAPGPGHVLIETFMDDQLKAYDAFLAEIMSVLAMLAFTQVSIAKEAEETGG